MHARAIVTLVDRRLMYHHEVPMIRGESMFEAVGDARMSLRLLCVEDDPLVQRAVRRALPEFDVAIVGTIAASRELMLHERFGAWLIDISIPDGSGIELLAWARKRGDKTPALVMTGLVDRQPVNEAQALGAEFLYKPYSASNLRAFVARTYANLVNAPDASRRIDELVARASLTTREEEIVRAIARGVDRSDLAQTLGVKENTVKTHIRGLLEKTGHRDLGQVYRELVGPIG
jgi:two-component system vancomycin resistance associated response regulator VraR